jgi:hypothetical protein
LKEWSFPVTRLPRLSLRSEPRTIGCNYRAASGMPVPQTVNDLVVLAHEIAAPAGI